MSPISTLEFTGSELVGSPWLEKVACLCARAAQERKQARVNYAVSGWENSPNTLFYLLFQEKRFDAPRGIFHLACDGDELVAFAGAYAHTTPGVLIGLVRSYVHPDYRNRQVLGRSIFAQQMEYGRKHGFTKIWLTFNDYNRPILTALKRIARAKAISLGSRNASAYSDLTFLPEKIVIANTPQYVAEKRL